jgi:hypothetical protein
LLREISKERGVPIIWNEGRFQDQFKRKTLSIDPSLTTSHAHVMFSNTLKPEDVVEVGVMYEQLRDGRDRLWWMESSFVSIMRMRRKQFWEGVMETRLAVRVTIGSKMEIS